MGGTQGGTVSNTYSTAMTSYAQANPNANPNYLNAGFPLGITAIPNGTTIYPGSGTGSTLGGSPYYASASNYINAGSDVFWYSVPDSYGSASSPSTGVINGGVKVKMTGKLVYYFKVQWQSYGAPAPKMPDHIDLLLKTTVLANASVAYLLSLQTSGLTAQATASDGSPYNETASASANSTLLPNSNNAVVGYHLVTASVNSAGIAQTYLNGTASYQASNSVPSGVLTFPYPSMPTYPVFQQTNGPTTASAGASVSCGVRLDHREVSITSSDIETSYKFGPLNATTNSYPQNVRGTDGSIVTDSAVSPPLTQPGSVNAWLSNPTLVGQAPGFATPVFAWSLPSGAGSLSASSNTPNTHLFVSFPLSSTDTALNKQSTVRLDVTDAGGITGANTFVVRWHYPKESATLLSSGQPFWQPAERKSVTTIGYIDGDATGIFGYSTYADFFPTASSDIFPAAANLPPSPWSAFVAAVGVVASQVQPVASPASCNFDQCWTSPFSTGLPSPADPALMSSYQMNPLLMVHYQEQTWQYEQYGQKGYLGLAQEGFNHFLGQVQSAGEFTKIVQPPPGG